MCFIGVFSWESFVEKDGSKWGFMSGGSFEIPYPVLCPDVLLEYGFQLLVVSSRYVVPVLKAGISSQGMFHRSVEANWGIFRGDSTFEVYHSEEIRWV